MNIINLLCKFKSMYETLQNLPIPLSFAELGLQTIKGGGGGGGGGPMVIFL